jgi:hypothetical protein
MEFYLVILVLGVVLVRIIFKRKPIHTIPYLPLDVIDEIIKHLPIKEQCAKATICKTVAESIKPRRKDVEREFLCRLWKEIVTLSEPHYNISFSMICDATHHITISCARDEMHITFHNFNLVCLPPLQDKILKWIGNMHYEWWTDQLMEVDGSVIFAPILTLGCTNKRHDFLMFLMDSFQEVNLKQNLIIMDNIGVGGITISFRGKDEKLEVCHKKLFDAFCKYNMS